MKRTTLGCAAVVAAFAATFGCAGSDESRGSEATDEATAELRTGTFACGSSARCKVGKQYCLSSTGGARPPPGQAPSESHSCRALPSTCDGTITCASCFPELEDEACDPDAGTACFPRLRARTCGASRGNLVVSEMRP